VPKRLRCPSVAWIMSVGSPTNVVPLRSSRSGAADGRPTHTTVLYAVAGEEDLVEVAPVVAALERRPSFRQVVVHADAEPGLLRSAKVGGVHHGLAIGPGSHAERTAAALVAFEALLVQERPEIVVVAGDDDLVLAAALSAARQQIAIARLGSGRRCWDWTLTDEVNRSVIDRLADTLFTVSEDAGANLLEEGVPDGRIHFVGNTRIDMLRRYEARARSLAAWFAHGAVEQGYTLVTLERPDSVEAPERLQRILGALGELAVTAPVLLLQHPRTCEVLAGQAAQALLTAGGIRSIDPAPYVEGLSLKAGAGAIVTDAGAVQDEASALGVRCYTLQQTSAHTITLTHGTNVLLGHDPSAIASVRPSRGAPTPAAIPLWDGHAAERIAEALAANYTLAAAYAGSS
jgi:UDP-N-acetylglucosamine 2-epimerase (non-hydrolysing)